MNTHSNIPPHIEPIITEVQEQMLARDVARERLQAMRAEDLVLPSGVRLDEFLAVEDDPVQYLVDELLTAGGNALLSAQQKAGKTTLMGNLVRAAVDDELFLERFRVQFHRRIVLLDCELDTRMLRRWLREHKIVNADRVTVVPMKGRLNTFGIHEDALREKWAAWLRDQDAGLVILDPLRPVLDSLGLSEDKDAGKFLVAWDALKLEAGVDETVIAHHMGHGTDRARGDSRLIDWADANWRILKHN